MCQGTTHVVTDNCMPVKVSPQSTVNCDTFIGSYDKREQFPGFRLLSRVSTLTRDIDIAILSVCPSVCDIPVLDENGLTCCHSFFSLYGSPIILVLPASNIFTNF